MREIHRADMCVCVCWDVRSRPPFGVAFFFGNANAGLTVH